MANSSYLMRTRRFFPLFMTQFLGALNDNIFKNALVIYIAYILINKYSNSEIMVTMVALLFILPFFLFSAIAGQVADKYDRAKIARIVKIAEIAIMTLAAFAFYIENIYLLFLTLFLMGSQSAFFGPVKYGIIPQLMSKDEVLSANGIISGATFVAILLGAIIGGLLIMSGQGLLIITILTIICSILGCIFSYFIPRQQAAAKLEISYNIFTQTFRIITLARQKKEIFLSMIGVAWFWFLGATFLAQFPNYVSNILFANNEVVTLFLATFSIAVAIGSMICNKLLKGQITAKLAPISLLFVAIFTIDLYFATAAYQPLVTKVGFLGFDGFLASIGSHRIIVDLFFVAFFCGTYVVPLYSIIQVFTSNGNRSRIIAALNIFDSAFMVISSLLIIVLYYLGLNSIQIFLSTSIINFLFLVLVYQLNRSINENS